MWKDFETKFGGILKRLARHKDLVESRASVSQYRVYREDITEMKFKLDEIVSEQTTKKLTAVKEWLAVGSIQDEDHTKFTEIRKTYQGTTRWITKNDQIKDWIDSDGE